MQHSSLILPAGLIDERSQPLAKRNSQARRAAATLFLVDGMTFGTWAALIPTFQQTFDLSPGRIGTVLFGLVTGAMISMPLAGKLIARHSSRQVVSFAALAFTASLTLLALAPGFPFLVAAAVLFGAFKGMLDVSVNAQAITVENAVARPIMSSFQAFWSLGGLGAAFLLSAALSQGFSHTVLILIMAVLLFMLALFSIGGLLPDKSTEAKPAARSWRPDPRLLRLGGLAFLALFSEGVLLDWSAVFAHTVAHASVAVAPVAFAIFALSMAAGRFSGDFVIARLGPVMTMRLSGGLIAAGIALAVILQSWGMILAGFAVTGFGVANLVPVLFGAAGRVNEGGAGPAIATVTTMGYLGFLSGPPVIGAIASVAGLPSSFLVVLVFGIVIATIGVAVLRPSLGPSR